MASWQLQLISAIIIERDLKTVEDSGISLSTFTELEAKALFEFIEQFANDHTHYGEVAGVDLITELFPTVALPDPQQSLPALCELVKRDKLTKDLAGVLDNMADLLEDHDPEGALELMQLEMGVLGEQHGSNDVDFGSTAKDAIVEEYETITVNNGALGLPFPWKELTEGTGGMEAGDLIVVYSIPKSLKTWLGLLCAVYLYDECGCRVLVYSQEMNIQRLRRRCSLILGQISYRKYRRGELSQAEYDYLISSLAALEDEAENGKQHKKLIFTKGMGKKGMNLSVLRRKVDVYKPDFVLLDSAYLMSDDMDWRTITKLTQGIKQIADSTGTRIMAINQENETRATNDKGRGTGSIANSPSWSQDADMLLRPIREGDLINLHVPAARESNFKGIRINAIPADDFSFKDYDLKSYKDFEDDNKPPPPPKKKKESLKGLTKYHGTK